MQALTTRQKQERCEESEADTNLLPAPAPTEMEEVARDVLDESRFPLTLKAINVPNLFSNFSTLRSTVLWYPITRRS